ncbi:Lipocalin-like domain-containing protein [Flavobacterium gillisiae]|uniref:Lipocalin-like domain-containing protein n=1 Tax=Flavobacterium gillisiae TaxID=150146 RepID=A0A1H4EYN8_9FLAO|nr:lipocalin family protein [Flavobacterium gillisiae]SEA90143.1 Lipocalin-like domain-containing protein [Flavobacterium gillisiae]
MKKILFLTAMALVLFSCKSTSATDTKLDKGAQVAMKGNWVISSVTYPGSEYIKVNSFEIADSQCFVGSTWKFVSNNNKGNMALTKYDCPVFSSPITWFVNKNGEFVLKVLDADIKAKKVREGYVLHVANQTENAFQLIDKGNVEGKTISVVYQFQRAN